MKKYLICFLILLPVLVLNTNYAGATVNDFTISNFTADYYLSRSKDKVSHLKTIETITAEFPEINQNHGIERAIPMVYDNHSTNVSVVSVKDLTGKNLAFTSTEKDNNLILRIGAADVYVHGLNSYVITYNQDNVTRFASDTNKDEFYWNVNGNQWKQKFLNVTARLHLESNLSDSIVGEQFCYYGKSGENKRCNIVKSVDGYIANVSNLGAGENMTIATGYDQSTFKDYVMNFNDFMARYFFYVSTIIMVIGLVLVMIIRAVKGSGVKGRGIIIAEYLPPKDVDVALSSVVIDRASNWVAAIYIDLAVRHNVKIIDGGDGKAYSIEYINSNGLNKTELAVIESLFGSNPQMGSRYNIVTGSPDTVLADKVDDIYSDVSNSAKSLGYFKDRAQLIALMLGVLIATLGIALGIGFIYGKSNLNLSQVLFWIAIFCLVLGFFISISTQPLSQKGRELSDYLKGLELYIKVAEEDRIKMLQSPQGASRVSVDINDSAQMVVLYERVLPYAILFGQEKQWASVIGKYYEQTNQTPNWYAGNSMFNAMMFSSAMNSFSTSAVSNSYIAPSSSSIGGSSGGGFSGGGGGGGGGGGW